MALALLHFIAGRILIALAHIGFGESAAFHSGVTLFVAAFHHEVIGRGFPSGRTDSSANGTLFGTLGILGAANITNYFAHDKPPVESYLIPFLFSIVAHFYK